MSEKIESLLNIVEEKAKNLQNIVDNLQAAIIVTDIDGDIILINKYAEKEFFLKEEKKNIFYQENFIEFRKIIENKIKNKDRKEEKIICKDKVYKLLHL